MTEKQIDKWLRRQFSPIGWVLIGYHVLMNLLVFVTMAIEQGKQAMWNLATGNFLFDFDWDALWSNGWGYVAACAVLLVILHAWKGSGYWRDVRTSNKKMTLLTLVTVVGISMSAQLLNSVWIGLLEWISNAFNYSMIPLLESVSGSSGSLSMFLYGVLFAPFAEEFLFRGYILNVMKPYGRRFAILGSALLFGVFHGNLLQVPYAIVMGLLLGWLTVEYSIGWAIFLHVFNNLILAEGISRMTEMLPAMVADWLIMGVFLAFSLIALGILIAKRSEIRDYRQKEWIDRRCIKCLFTSFGVLLLLVMMAENMVSYFFV